MNTTRIRLNKFLVDTGCAPSRRKADDVISSGVVFVNGKQVYALATFIDVEKDYVVVRGVPAVRKKGKPVVYLVHKPKGYVSSKRAGKNEQSVYTLVPSSRTLAIAGRLDKESEGLLIMTDNGALVYELTHPSLRHEKVYRVQTLRPVTKKQKQQLLRGVSLAEGTAVCDSLQLYSQKEIELTIHQGWNRQIRRMITAVGNHVVRLQRVAIGPYRLGPLKPGAYKRLPGTIRT